MPSSQDNHTTATSSHVVEMHEDNESNNESTHASNSKFDWLNSSPSFFNLNKSAKKSTTKHFTATSSHVVENKANVIVDDVDDFLSFDVAAPIKIKRKSIDFS